MSSAEARWRSVERSAAAARLRLGVIIALVSGWILIIASTVYFALVPVSLTHRNTQMGIFVAGEGFLVLGIWFQALKSTVGNMSDVSEVQGTRSWWSTALWIGFGVTAFLVLAISVIPLIVLLTNPVSSPQYNGAINVDKAAIFANFGWATLGLVWWAIQRSIRDSRTPG